MCHNKTSEVTEQTANTISDPRLDILKNVFMSQPPEDIQNTRTDFEGYGERHFSAKANDQPNGCTYVPDSSVSLTADMFSSTHKINHFCQKQSNELATVLLTAHKLINTKRTQTRRGNIQRLNIAITTDEIKYMYSTSR